MGHVVLIEDLKELGLKPNEMIILAIIYGFSQEKQGVFHGSRSYLAEWAGCSVETVKRCLKNLEEAGLIEKGKMYDGDVEHNTYRYTGGSKCTGVKMTRGQNDPGTGVKMTPNNKVDNKYINSHDNARVSYADFVAMTEAEYQKLVDRFGREDTERMVEILNAYKGSTGKKYKSDYLAILNWVVGRLAEEKARQYPKTAAPAPKRESPVVAMMKASRESFQRIADRHADDQTKEVEP